MLTEKNLHNSKKYFSKMLKKILVNFGIFRKSQTKICKQFQKLKKSGGKLFFFGNSMEISVLNKIKKNIKI